MNVIDKYKDYKWNIELIKEDINKNAFPYAVLMENFQGDFTIGSVLRSCNALGGKRMYYYGRKKYDRRAAVGTHHYTCMTNIKDFEELLKLKNNYKFVALEINMDSTVPIYDYEWEDDSMIIVGEEGTGISKEVLDICDDFVHIPQYGSVRSMNAAVAASIAMQDYICKYLKKKNEL